MKKAMAGLHVMTTVVGAVGLVFAGTLLSAHSRIYAVTLESAVCKPSTAEVLPPSFPSAFVL